MGMRRSTVPGPKRPAQQPLGPDIVKGCRLFYSIQDETIAQSGGTWLDPFRTMVMTRRKIRMGMTGGGPGAMIGSMHRMAARLDNQIELVCGAFSSDPAKSRDMAERLHLAPDRGYPSFDAMMEDQAGLPQGERMDFLTIATPNHLHHHQAVTALDAGFHVLSDKPATRDLDEMRDLKAVIDGSGRLYGLTHGCLGFPMVKEARHRVACGQLGPIRKIYGSYVQSWLADAVERDGLKQAQWRTDPERSGAAGCMSDIGTHAHCLAEYMSGQNIARVKADLRKTVAGRPLDDDGACLFETDGGASGVLLASQICVGEENSLSIQVHGEKAGLSWTQSRPSLLVLRHGDGRQERLFAGHSHAYLSDAARAHCRVPGGHSESFIEAFANIYRNFADAVGRWPDRSPDPIYDFPDARTGLRGMAFIDAVVRSHQQGGEWASLRE